MKIYKFRATLLGVCLALSSYSAMGVDWPPTLDPNPAVQPPKWDWQLAVPVMVNPDSSIEIYDIDMFDNEFTGMVEILHDLGKKVICYVDVGSWENFRDDKDDFPLSILGNKYDGFPDEKWLDIRDVNPAKSETGTALATILSARILRAADMGCDAVEPDNMDGYDETAHDASGFPLNYEDQIYFNLWVADAVHAQGMAVGLKNNINQAQDPRIIEAFDFVVSEQCFQYNECSYFSGFLAVNKPVFEAEYRRALSNFCPNAKANRISAIKKRTSLNAIRDDCSAYYNTAGGAMEASFTSIAAEDGWVRESSENSGVGGNRNTGGTGSKAIRMGDHKADKQYKSIVSFDTSSIPDGATITGARLELTRGGNRGQNPFNTHGTCYVDIKTGVFSGNAALENIDFQDPADAEREATVSNQGGSGTVYTVDLNAAGNFINKAGRTQLRLYFSLDDNDDHGNDIAGFFSANNRNAARHPRLFVTYVE